MKTMKKIVAILAAALMLCSILPLSAMAANVADLDTIAKTNTSYTTVTTTDGWKATNAAVLSGGSSNSSPKFNFIDSSESARAVCLNGKKSAQGTLTSPTLSGGISKLTLSYGLPFSDNKIGLSITITGADGTVAENTISNTSASKYTKYDFEWVLDTPITGDFTIVIKNTSPSGSTSNKDRTAIWNVAWESASVTAECDHDSLECGDTCPECGDYTKEHKFSNNCVAECENGCGEANPNYADHVYSNALDNSCNSCGKTREVVMPTDPTEIVEAAYALAQGDSFPSAVELTGIISSVDTAYSTQYSNVTVTIDVLDADGNVIEGKAIQCYRLKGTGADVIAVGDTITVSGILKNYGGKIEFDSGCTLVSYEQTGCKHEYAYECTTTCSICGEGERDVVCVSDTYACQDGLCIYCGNDVLAVEHAFDDEWDADCNYGCGYTREVEEKPEMTEATLDFSTKDQRAEYSTTIQVWENDGLKLTNNKGSSASNVGDFAAPARFYKGSEVIIEYPGMVKLVIDASGIEAKYAWDATLENAGLEFTVEDGIYTVTLADPAASITLTTAAQIRANSITATAIKAVGECEHVYDNTCDTDCNLCTAVREIEHTYVEDIIDATCTKTGIKTYECSVCGHSYDEEIPVKPHTYVDGICSGCGAELPMESTITFGEDKAQRVEYSSESQKWEKDGLVFINNKAESTTNIGDYASPVRLYKSSEIVISFPGMTSLVIDGPASADYAWDATLENAGLTFTVEDGVYTITFAEPTDSITLVAANQVRANTITASRVAACEHEYDNACDVDCNLCYEAREVSHNVLHVAAVAPTCALMGNVEHWYCDVCGMAWLDAECVQNTNLKAVKLPSTGEHAYDDQYDADCNECGDIREVPEKPVETVYGDANGDGELTAIDAMLLQQYIAGYEVTMNETSADANGDGEITAIDAMLLQQYIAGYDVTLGPEKVFNDGELSVW